MSAYHTSLVWRHAQVSGTPLAVLLALADGADPKGRASVSMRELSGMCNVSKTRISAVLDDLAKQGLVAVVDTGGGRANPSTYRLLIEGTPKLCPVDTEVLIEPPEQVITVSEAPAPALERIPDSTHVVEPPSDQVSSDAVLDLVLAAGVERADQPFYWNRAQHVSDLKAAVEASEYDLKSILVKVRDAALNGAYRDDKPRSVAQILKRAGVV